MGVCAVYIYVYILTHVCSRSKAALYNFIVRLLRVDMKTRFRVRVIANLHGRKSDVFCHKTRGDNKMCFGALPSDLWLCEATLSYPPAMSNTAHHSPPQEKENPFEVGAPLKSLILMPLSLASPC